MQERNMKKYLAPAIVIVAMTAVIIVSCTVRDASHLDDIVGGWHSKRDGRPRMIIYRERWGDYMVIFRYLDINGKECSGTFPIIEHKGCLFIDNGYKSRMMILYDEKTDAIRLLPGGRYVRDDLLMC